MIDGAKSKGATPIISSQTTRNPYRDNRTFIDTPTLWVGYANRTAAAKGVPYVDHFAVCLQLSQGAALLTNMQATIQLYAKLGKEVVNGFYNVNDTTHTTPVRLKPLLKADILTTYYLGRGQSSSIRFHMRSQLSCSSERPLGLHQVLWECHKPSLLYLVYSIHRSITNGRHCLLPVAVVGSLYVLCVDRGCILGDKTEQRESHSSFR